MPISNSGFSEKKHCTFLKKFTRKPVTFIWGITVKEKYAYFVFFKFLILIKLNLSSN